MNIARKLGQGMVEYALILVLVAVAAVVIMTVLGSTISQVFSNVVSAL
jgi:Flp pilus assembly pilin Flp